jgi:hypothetical protein
VLVVCTGLSLRWRSPEPAEHDRLTMDRDFCELLGQENSGPQLAGFFVVIAGERGALTSTWFPDYIIT